jgi:hypothetical protein
MEKFQITLRRATKPSPLRSSELASGDHPLDRSWSAGNDPFVGFLRRAGKTWSCRPVSNPC